MADITLSQQRIDEIGRMLQSGSLKIPEYGTIALPDSPSTGLSSGGKVIDIGTGKELGSLTPSGTKTVSGELYTGSITPSVLTPTTEVKPTPPKADTTNYNALVAGGQGVIGANVPTAPSAPAPVESDFDKRLDTLMKSMGPAPESVAGAYDTAYNASGIQTVQQEAVAKQAKVRSAQAEFAGIQAQLQGVISKRDANNLKLEGQASAGQVTGTILGRQQQENNRQAAIEALPLQAVALAKQAEVALLQGEAEYAQSTLKIAQDKLNTAFKLKSEDIKNAYDYAKENRKAIFDFLSDEQKLRATAKQKQDDRNFTTQQNNLNNAQALSLEAMKNGQGELAAKITQLDPNSDSYVLDLAELQKQIVVKATTGALSDFEAAFQRTHGRLPDVNELTAFKQSTQTTFLTATGAIDKVLTPQEQELYGAPSGTKLSEVQGQIPIAPAQREKLTSFTQALPIVEAIRDMASQLDLADSIMGTILRGAKLKARSLLPSTAEGQYESQKRSFLTLLSRAAGERGVVTDQDVNRIAGNIPGFFDTKKSAKTKLERFASILKEVQTRAAAGYIGNPLNQGSPVNQVDPLSLFR